MFKKFLDSYLEKNKLFFWLMLNCICFFNAFQSESKIVVLICSYNNAKYYERNLLSLFEQTYRDWVGYYIDDNSQDGTYELAYDLAKRYNMLDKLFFIKNNKNLGAMENQYNVISQCEDTDIIVNYDGDDAFYDNNVLDFIKETYSDANVWLTYGSYVPMVEPFPVFCKDVSREKNIKEKNFFRKYPWNFSHLRTFYAGLFKKIKKEDLMKDGKFVDSAPDLAAMYPMLEMANGDVPHYKYIEKKLYVYNNMNPICEFRRRDLDIAKVTSFIQNKEPYSPIDSLF